MLPDFIQLKRQLSDAQANSFDLFGDPVLAKMRKFRQHEGDRFVIFREDGSRQSSPQREIRSEQLPLNLLDIQSRGEIAIRQHLSRHYEQIRAAGRRLLSEHLDEEIPTGFDFQGKPFTAEAYLAMLETMPLSFDNDGNWNRLDVWQEHPNPALLRGIDLELKRLEDESDLKLKLNALLVRKRQEWNVREAHRKLVN